MKTKNLCFAVAAFALAGCSQNEITEQNPDANAPIGFGVYAGVQTKGLVTDNTDTDGGSTNGLKVAGKGFGIQAYLTAGNYTTAGDGIVKTKFMSNQQVTWDGTGSAWTYTPAKFWPSAATDKISFFAYAPYSPTAAANGITLTDAEATADPKLTFELAATQKGMVDLVVSNPDESGNSTIDKTKPADNSKVTFKFKHVLSRVAMKARTSVDLSATGTTTKVFITGVSIEHSSKLYKKADLNMKSHAWTALSAPEYLDASYALADGHDTNTGILNFTTASFGDYNASSIDISTDHTNGVSLFPADQYLFFIPVDGSTGTGSAGDVSVKITYDVVTKVSASASDNTVSTVKNEHTVKLPAGAFKQGLAYVYTFTVSLDEIKVDVATDMNWDTTNGDVSVDVPEVPAP